MPSKFHKTTSECWQRTSGTQKSNPSLQKEVGKKYKRQKKRQKREGRSSVSGRESEKQSFQTPGNLLTAESVLSLGSTEGNIKGGKINKQLKPAHCEPYGNSPSGKAVQTPAHTTSKQGLGREARCGLHRLE